MPDHHPDEPFYVRAVSELQDIEEAMTLAVSDIDSFEPCIIPGCPHHENEKTQQNSPVKSTSTTNNSGKRKEISNFEYPPQRKTAKKIVLENTVNDELNLSQNKFELPQGAHFNNLEDSGPVENEKKPQWLEKFGQSKCSTNSTPTTHHAFRRRKLQSPNGSNNKSFPQNKIPPYG
ncbi:hypothetical protein TNCV_967351 [Trichonephila clavipes]|nr:hypothetical protein TNCV_967351 [Trichonephila clavipes]